MALSSNNQEAATQISTQFYQRRRDRGGIFNQMERTTKLYNGDWAVPLPEMDESERPAVANLIGMGIDQFSMRVASVMPNLHYPSLHPGFAAADSRARARREANLGWWKMNNMKTKLRRRARYLTAYGTAPVSISPVSLDPQDKREIPFWRVRNPLSTFPAPSYDPDNMEPTDCIFVDYRPLSWLTERFPAQMKVLSVGDDTDTDLFSVLEYVDANETVLCVLGKERAKRPNPWSTNVPTAGSMQEVLTRIPNRAEICPVVIPGRITLDRLMGQFDQMEGMYERAAKLDALNTIAVFRGVFPDEWITSPSGAATKPRVVVEADGRVGQRGLIENGQLQIVQLTPGSATQSALDNLERNQRLSGGVPEEFGGESGSNIRTARRGAAVLSSAVDMPIQEYQEIFATSLEHENARSVAVMRAYYGSKKSMFFMGLDGKIPNPQYTPNETFETNLSEVKYPMPGTDVNGLIVGIGQRVGIGTMSTFTAMVMDPQIDDPEEEQARVQIEGIRKSMLSGVEQQAVSGQMSPVVIARIANEMLSERIPIEQALINVEKMMKQEQADQANQQAQAQPPAQGPPEASPDQQPGMQVGPQNPPQGAPQGAPASLEELLGSLHQPINTAGNAPSPSAKVAV